MAQIVSCNFSSDPFVLSSYQVSIIINFSKVNIFKAVNSKIGGQFQRCHS